MKKLWLYFGLMFVFLVGTSYAADSPLVELAKKEKERRAKIKASRTFTNKDVEEYIAKHKTPGAMIEGTTEGAEGTEVAAATEGESEDLATNEEYWRNKAQATADRVEQAQKKLDELQSDVNALTRSFYAEGDGVAQRGQIQAERNQRLDEIETVKKELEEAKQGQENLEEEARREGAPPGWIRVEEEEEEE